MRHTFVSRRHPVRLDWRIAHAHIQFAQFQAHVLFDNSTCYIDYLISLHGYIDVGGGLNFQPDIDSAAFGLDAGDDGDDLGKLVQLPGQAAADAARIQFGGAALCGAAAMRRAKRRGLGPRKLRAA